MASRRFSFCDKGRRFSIPDGVKQMHLDFRIFRVDSECGEQAGTGPIYQGVKGVWPPSALHHMWLPRCLKAHHSRAVRGLRPLHPHLRPSHCRWLTTARHFLKPSVHFPRGESDTAVFWPLSGPDIAFQSSSARTPAQHSAAGELALECRQSRAHENRTPFAFPPKACSLLRRHLHPSGHSLLRGALNPRNAQPRIGCQ